MNIKKTSPYCIDRSVVTDFNLYQVGCTGYLQQPRSWTWGVTALLNSALLTRQDVYKIPTFGETHNRHKHEANNH